MIEVGSGNLLTADVQALVNTVNTVGVMGKGIALQFKRAYPANFAAYRTACEAGEVRLGEMFVYDSGRLGPRRYVINFPTKGHWRSSSHLVDIRSGLVDLVRVVGELGVTSIAVPALGCGNGGLLWSEVRPLIEAAFTPLPEVRVVLFPPAGTPDPAQMPVGSARPHLTGPRAVLLHTIDRYLRQARAVNPLEGITELEIQKLAYFLQILGQPLRLAFTRGHYGPYAEALHHVLQRMEGHFLTGYGDRSAKVADLLPIKLAPDAAREAEGWIEAREPGAADLIIRLLRLVDGFETPYGVELLATVHFAAHEAAVPFLGSESTVDIDELIALVRQWSGRKARLFTAAHVRSAHDRLRHERLLPST